jgi:uncharacterized protein
MMSRATLEAVVRWQRALGRVEKLQITFHGGEPLLPGVRFYHMALPLLKKELEPWCIHFNVQSNLWFLTDELCELFRQYSVSLGTSLDGPEEINDTQRGKGYFQRTMEGINHARMHGIQVGCICTFTRQSALRADAIFSFFLKEHLGFSVHPAIPSLTGGDSPWVLSPEEFASLLLYLLDLYLPHIGRIHINMIDAMARSISAGEGGICTFTDCLGKYLAVDPEGWIYPCQRFAGLKDFRLGNIHNCPTMEELELSPAWQAFKKRQEQVAEECGDCPFFKICRGGCPYNALAAGNGRFKSLRDPYCTSYRHFFEEVRERALREVFSEENMNAVVEGGNRRYGLLQKGQVIQLLRGGPSLSELQAQARKTVAAVALAVSNSVEEALEKLDKAGLITQPEIALRSLQSLREFLLYPPPQLLNLYIHVTYACNLSCKHCYAEASPKRLETMTVKDILHLAKEAAELGFRKIVITGGEPLMHPERDALLKGLASLCPEIYPSKIILRTNLTVTADDTLLETLAMSADFIVVSVDGDEVTHDARRGKGAYARTVQNLIRLRCFLPGERLVLTAVLTAGEVEGIPGDSVRSLAEELGAEVRLKPLLPLGRARDKMISIDAYSSLEEEGAETVLEHTSVRSTCGLGMNISVAPDGECFPCHALSTRAFSLGNACKTGLKEIVQSERFEFLRQMTVDKNPHCSNCAFRYLCGGYCRAWRSGEEINSPPPDCTPLRKRAEKQLQSALEMLNISFER